MIKSEQNRKQKKKRKKKKKKAVNIWLTSLTKQLPKIDN